jgi:uncharacterized protein (TIGR00251 family)
MSEPWPCLAVRGERTLLAVAVTPNARRTGADGLHDGALRVRLAAPPVDGKANEALTAWLAAQLGLPKRAVQVLHGISARRKQLAIELEEPAVVRWLDSLGIAR